MLNFLKYLILLIISPVKGWEDIAMSGLRPRRAFNHGLLPMIALLGVSCLVSTVYNSGPTLWDAIMNMAVSMGAYFVTYFVAMFVMTSFAESHVEENRLDAKHASIFITFNLAILIVFNILRNVIPVENALINFLPIFDILIMWKGDNYLHIKKDHIGQMMLITVPSILLPPLIIDWAFSSII